MNLPNLLTLSRFFLSFAMAFFVLDGSGSRAALALAVFLAASLTDYWDGTLARRTGQVTVFGALMDPIADKMLTLCAFLSFWKLALLPGLWVAVVVVRDVAVTSARLLALGRDHSARPSGKKKTLFQMIYISGVLAYLAARRSAWWLPDWEDAALTAVRAGMLVIVALTLWSGLSVLRRIVRPETQRS